MKKIINRLEQLGGKIAEDKQSSLIEVLQNITFDEGLIGVFDEDIALELVDEFLEETEQQADFDNPKFIEKLVNDITNREFANRWNGSLFTPFTENTEDYEEWKDVLDIENLSEIVEFTQTENPEFLYLVDSEGFPNYYFICLSDPNKNDPMVWSTDHEVFFSEVEKEGKLSEFLDSFFTKQEFAEFLKTEKKN